MTGKRNTCLPLLLLGTLFLSSLFFLFSGSNAAADVFRWVDEDGVTHFTDTPKHKGYRVFIKEKRSYRSSSKKSSGRAYAGRETRFTDRDTYDNIIREAAETYGLEFALVKAVIKVESNFNPRARSPKGARGLMQVMPFNYSNLGIDDPYNPRDSIMGGSRYLSQMMNNYGGDVDLALAAYNAGPGAVDSCGRRIPSIPETRSYVSRVKEIYNIYAARQANSDAAVFRADGSAVKTGETTLADTRTYQ